jgi:DNA polymerase-1
MSFLTLDVETTKAPRHMPYSPGAMLCTVVAKSSTQDACWDYVINHSTTDWRTTNYVPQLQSIIDKHDFLICHNVKFDLMWLHHIGINTENIKLWCTQVAQYIISAQTLVGRLSLNDVCASYGLEQKSDKVKEYWDADIDTPDIPLDILIPYNKQDVLLTEQVAFLQFPQIKELGLTKTIEIEMESIRFLMEMEYNGLRVNKEKLKSFAVEYGNRIEEVEDELTSIVGTDCNLGSNPQLSVCLFGGEFTRDGLEEIRDSMGRGVRFKSGPRRGELRFRKTVLKETYPGLGFIPPEGSKTATEGIFSVGVDTRSKLRPKTPQQRRFLELLEERGKLAKLVSTYFIGLHDRAIGDIVHPSLNQTIAVTTRLTSSNPNGQNMPRGDGPVKQCIETRY